MTGRPPFDAAALRFGEPEAPISWNARNSTKPGRGGDGTLVVHASPAWSRAHLEREPGEVSALLCAEFGRMPGLSAVDQGAIRHAAAHRWRYALVEQAVGTPCLWSLGDRLGAGGDPCLGGRGEAAYASGLALDEQVVE